MTGAERVRRHRLKRGYLPRSGDLTVRPSRWSRRLSHPIAPLDGERLTDLRGVADYMQTLGDRFKRQAWQHACELLLEAAEHSGSVDAVRAQVILALLIDGKLDAAATVPAL